MDLRLPTKPYQNIVETLPSRLYPNEHYYVLDRTNNVYKHYIASDDGRRSLVVGNPPTTSLAWGAISGKPNNGNFIYNQTGTNQSASLRIDGTAQIGGTVSIGGMGTDAFTWLYNAAGSQGTILRQVGNDSYLYNWNNYNLILAFNGSIAGKVGIGTNAPTYTLDVNGTIHNNTYYKQTANGALLWLHDTSGWAVDAKGWFINTAAFGNGAAFTIATATDSGSTISNIFNIHRTGNVSIGTTTDFGAGYALQVQNHARIGGFIYAGNQSNNSGVVMDSYSVDAMGMLQWTNTDIYLRNNTATGNIYFGTNSNNTNGMMIIPDGKVLVGRTTVSAAFGAQFQVTGAILSSTEFDIDSASRRWRIMTDGGTQLWFRDHDSSSNLLILDGNGGYIKALSDIEITGVGKGYIVPSPDGTRWRITVSNAGIVTAALA